MLQLLFLFCLLILQLSCYCCYLLMLQLLLLLRLLMLQLSCYSCYQP